MNPKKTWHGEQRTVKQLKSILNEGKKILAFKNISYGEYCQKERCGEDDSVPTFLHRDAGIKSIISVFTK